MLHKSTFNFMERLIHIPIYKQLSSHRHFHGSGGGGGGQFRLFFCSRLP